MTEVYKTTRLLEQSLLNRWDIELFNLKAQRHVWQTPNSISAETYEHGGGGMIIWCCFAVTAPGYLPVIEWTMNSSGFQNILVVIFLVVKFGWKKKTTTTKLGHATSAKHPSKFTPSERLKKWKHQGFGMIKSKSRLQLNWSAVVGL